MKRFIETHDAQEYDVAVIGGGITGAAVAYDAACRGLRVALMEKQDFGCATSAATSKLIHGGFRYLANGEFRIVRESLKERRILSNIAPNLVTPIQVLVPCYNRGITRHTGFFRAGMMIYDALSFDKGSTWDPAQHIGPHRTIPVPRAAEVEPNMPREGLKKLFTYYDCASLFPERLTLAFVRSAVRRGAHAANYCKVESFLTAGGRVSGVRVRDLIRNREVEVRARLCINCGGPWADLILDAARGDHDGKRIKRSEGIHILTRRPAVNHMVAMITDAGKGFVMTPWRGHTLFGPTDKEYKGDPDAYRVTPEAVRELVDLVNRTLKGSSEPIGVQDVVHTYGGLRPLVDDKSADVRGASRRYEIFDNAADGFDGLITVEGGKYTTSRNLAESVMRTVFKKLGASPGQCVTHTQPLDGSDIKSVSRFLQELKAANTDLPAQSVDCIGRYYGTEAPAVLCLARTGEDLREPLNQDGENAAQALYAIQHEMALTLKDIFLRRTGLGTLGRPADQTITRIAGIAARELGWDQARLDKEIQSLKDNYIL